ncbi:Polyubiquitin (Fragment) [Linum grandiflorum]
MAATSDEENGIFEEEEVVELKIKTLRQSYVSAMVHLTETTVMEVKEIIEDVLGYLPHDQLLYYKGRVLEDDNSTLAENNISKDDFLFFMPTVPEDPIITIGFPNGNSIISVPFDPTITVMDVKMNIEDHLGDGFPCHRQRLYLDDVLLEDMDTLHASNVYEDSHLIVKLRRGGRA